MKFLNIIGAFENIFYTYDYRAIDRYVLAGVQLMLLSSTTIKVHICKFQMK